MRLLRPSGRGGLFDSRCPGPCPGLSVLRRRPERGSSPPLLLAAFGAKRRLNGAAPLRAFWFDVGRPVQQQLGAAAREEKDAASQRTAAGAAGAPLAALAKLAGRLDKFVLLPWDKR